VAIIPIFFYQNQSFSMKKHLFQWVSFVCLLCITSNAYGQTLYFSAHAPSPSSAIFRVDLATCQVCPVLDIPDGIGTLGEVLVLPGGDLLHFSSPTGLRRYDPPNPNPVAIIPNAGMLGGYVHPNGTIYLAGGTQLFTFNPTNNTVTLVGNFPVPCSVYNLFFQNGQLYGFAGCPGTPAIVQINLTNPAASTVVLNNLNYLLSATSTPNGNIYVGDEDGEIFLFDLATGATTSVCNLPVPLYSIGLTNAPAGTPELPCNCLSTAATPVQTTLNLCVPNTANVAFNNNANIFSYETIRYILYTDLTNPLGSIVQNNPTPSFNFGPPLQENVPYYVAQVVGSNLNGNFDPNSPCLDLSDPVVITWRPRPEVTNLSVLEPTLCAGECQSVSLSLSGTPPFAYSWQIQQNGTLITPLQVAFGANSNPISFQACVPPNAPPGQFSVVICAISDAFCGNQ
jgi:hypothetical protein